MTRLEITTGKDSKYIALIASTFNETNPIRIDVAIAYATHRGVAELVERLEKESGWNDTRKRWLVGIDFCRTDPIAVQHLVQLPRSLVRVFDGDFVSSRSGCVPRISYHPKLYIFHGQEKNAVVAGSGNLSHTGLKVGIEAGISVPNIDMNTFNFAKNWFNRFWRKANKWSEIKPAYSAQYMSHKNRSNPIPTDDDSVPDMSNNRGYITPEQLRKIRICQHLWIEAGNLHKNRGPKRSGNQLMLKRNSRVFFGFAALDLPRDSTIGSVEIEYDGYTRRDCSFRFSNNGMDVLTLPIPDTEGPKKYDQETLRFERIGVRKFRLYIGSGREISRWKRESRRIDGVYKMSSGREWGVY